MPKNKKHSSKHHDQDSSSDSEEDERGIVLNKKKYQKLLSQIFPSEYINSKVECMDTKTKKAKKKSKQNTTSRKQTLDILFEIVPSNRSSKKGKKSPNRRKTKEDEESEETLDEEDSETSESDYEEESCEEDEEETSEDDEYDEEEDEDEEEEEDEEETSEEDEDEEEEEDEDEDETEEDETEEETSENEEENKIVSKTISKKKKTDEEIYEELKQGIKKVMSYDIENKKTRKQIQEFNKTISKMHKKVDKKKKQKNSKEYMKLISNKNSMNDVKFFREKLTASQQEKMIDNLQKVNKLTTIDKPYRLKLLECENIPDEFKGVAMKKINAMKVIAEGGGEYHKLKCWIDTFLRIPFGKISTLPINKSDTKEQIQEYIRSSEETLDEAVYGMKDAKMQFMQMLAQWISNPTSIGNSIAIKGPMGTGKTTLIKEGVSKLLNREFAFIALGGATDSSFLEGHSYTYEGSTYGKIIDILIQCKSSNPVIYFDELDKVSDTPRGEEIIGVLTHLTDTAQNDKFHDKYFSEIDFDLSKCLFIFSYNDESKVNPILKDRMYNIETKGYNVDEKIVICRNYLIPKLDKELDFKPESIVISDEIIKMIVDTYTSGEKGVRNLKRCLEIIYSKLNLYHLMGDTKQLFGEDIIQSIKFPYNVTKPIVEKLITKPEQSQAFSSMYL